MSWLPVAIEGAKSILELVLTPQATLEEYHQHLLELARKASDELARKECEK